MKVQTRVHPTGKKTIITATDGLTGRTAIRVVASGDRPSTAKALAEMCEQLGGHSQVAWAQQYMRSRECPGLTIEREAV